MYRVYSHQTQQPYRSQSYYYENTIQNSLHLPHQQYQSHPSEEFQPSEYVFTYEPQNEDSVLNRFKQIVKDKSNVVFNFGDDNFWWNPPWYVINAIGEDNLRKHLSINDTPDSDSMTFLGYQEALVGHNRFTIATHDIHQGSYDSTLLETQMNLKNENDIITFTARLLKDGISYTDYLEYRVEGNDDKLTTSTSGINESVI